MLAHPHTKFVRACRIRIRKLCRVTSQPFVEHKVEIISHGREVVKRALVVIDPNEAAENLLAEAGDCVRGTEADVILLTTMSEESYERDVDTLNQIGQVENRTYRNDAPLKGAERHVRDLARTTLDDDIEYTPVSRLVEEGEEADTILEVAEEYECDHIFLSGRKRSPTGKALFGDRTQAVLLNAEAYVTVSLQ